MAAAALLLSLLAGCSGNGAGEEDAATTGLAAGGQDAPRPAALAAPTVNENQGVSDAPAATRPSSPILDPGPVASKMASQTSDVDAKRTDPAAATKEDEPEADVVVEVGEHNPAGAYVEDADSLADQPPADASTVGVLCNLNAEYIGGLAALAQAEDGLNTSFVALSLNDHIQVWEMLIGEHPEAREDVDRAKRILNYWHEAMAYEDEGLHPRAEEFYRKAEAEIAELSSDEAVAEEVGCL